MTAYVQETLGLVEDIFGPVQPRDFAVRLWEGTVWGPGPGQEARVTLILEHPGALRKMMLKPTELNLAECYIYGDIDLGGDVAAIVPVGIWLTAQKRSVWEKLGLARRLLKLPAAGAALSEGNGAPRLSGREHTLERDREAVTAHYDVSNGFYRLWLDSNMIYSCAYFARPEEDLDAAQERKLDMLCRKLRLQPGERFLDIGCGWGGLILQAAGRYGVDATGITLSQPQADEANRRIAAAGLQDRCRARVLDYRELHPQARFDKIASVGMVEHVGRQRLPEYFDQVFGLLEPGGAFLNHGIGDLDGRPTKVDCGFVRTYVFPDSDLPDLPTVLGCAEASHFETRDVESLREHYAMTLTHWVRRLEANHEAAVREVGQVKYRIWRLYMSGCAEWFRRGNISVYQALLVRRHADGRAGVPLTRADWYRQAEPVERVP